MGTRSTVKNAVQSMENNIEKRLIVRTRLQKELVLIETGSRLTFQKKTILNGINLNLEFVVIAVYLNQK